MFIYIRRWNGRVFPTIIRPGHSFKYSKTLLTTRCSFPLRSSIFLWLTTSGQSQKHDWKDDNKGGDGGVEGDLWEHWWVKSHLICDYIWLCYGCPSPSYSTRPDVLFCVPVDLDGNGYICDDELGELLRGAGHPVPGYKLRIMIQSLDRNDDGRISFEEFLAVRSSAAQSASYSHLLFGAFLTLSGSLFSVLPKKQLALLGGAAKQLLAAPCTTTELKGLYKPHSHTHSLGECGSEVS